MNCHPSLGKGKDVTLSFGVTSTGSCMRSTSVHCDSSPNVSKRKICLPCATSTSSVVSACDGCVPPSPPPQPLSSTATKLTNKCSLIGAADVVPCNWSWLRECSHVARVPLVLLRVEFDNCSSTGISQLAMAYAHRQ